MHAGPASYSCLSFVADYLARVQIMLPLLLLVPLREAPPGKAGTVSEPLLTGSAESVAGDVEAGNTAPAGIEGGAAAPLSIPPPVMTDKGKRGSQQSSPQASPQQQQQQQQHQNGGWHSQPVTPERCHSSSLPQRPSTAGSLPGSSGSRSPRRSLQRRRSLAYGTSPRLSGWGGSTQEG